MLVLWTLRNISSGYVHNSIHVYGFAYLLYWWNIYAKEFFFFFNFYLLTVSNIQEKKMY